MRSSVKIISSILNRRTKTNNRMSLANFEATSMGDIAFLLLIFFIVTGSFVVRQGIFFTLPSKTSGVQNVAIDSIMEIYPGANDFTYKEKKYSGKELTAEMKKLFAQNKDLIVLFRMSPEVPYERLTDSLSIVRETGVQFVSVKDVETPAAEAE